MRIALVGAVESSQAALETMIEIGHAPAALVTLPLAKAGRHSDFIDLRPIAEPAAVPVIEAADVNAPEVLQKLRELALDVIFVIGWSQICRAEFLALPRLGCVGFHPALLPDNRGRAVIAWTILQGKTRAGISLFWMDEGMDSGDLLVQSEFPVAEDETSRTLCDKVVAALRTDLREVFRRLDADEIPRTAQDHSKATYCARRTADDGLLDWSCSAREVWALIRAAGDPYPGAFTFDGAKVTIWSADLALGKPFWGLPGQIQQITPDGVLVQCGDREHVLLKEVQREGSSRQHASAAGFKMHAKFGKSAK